MSYFAKTTLVAVAGLLSAVSPLYAVATLRISANGGATWTQVRDSEGLGQVSYTGFIGGVVGNTWSISIAAGATKPTVGSAGDPIMDLSAMSVSSTAAGTLMIEFSDRSFSAPLIGNFFTTSLHSENPVGGSTSVRSYWDSANVLFERNTLLGAISQTAPIADSSVSSTGALPESGLYSLTMRVVITHGAGGGTSFDSHLVDPIPDGGFTVSLLGFALLALAGIATWIKRLRRV